MTGSGRAVVRVTLAVASFRRPQGLRRLLLSLQGLARPRLPETELSVVVIDNSPDEEARPVVRKIAEDFPFALAYARQSERGITHVRHLGVELARAAGADFIAFLDDDQLAAPGWLDGLVSVQARTDADVVVGAVRPVFLEPPPRWIRDGGFFVFPEHPDGAEIDYGRTGNVLIRTALFEDARIAFDHSFALTGGEDTILFQAVQRAGYSIIYSAQGLAYETVPASRARLAWLLQRWFRTGHVEAELRRRGGAGGSILINLARGLIRVAVGTVALLTSALVLGFGRGYRMVRPLFTLARGCGLIASTLGYRYAEYRRTHGS